MNDLGYILLILTLINMFASLVVSSRKSGYIYGMGLPHAAKWRIDRSGVDDYRKTMFLVAAIIFIVCAFFTQDLEATLWLTVINTLSIGYALAWEKIIRVK